MKYKTSWSKLYLLIFRFYFSFPKENVDILWVTFSVQKAYILQALVCIIDKVGEKEEQIFKTIHVT